MNFSLKFKMYRTLNNGYKVPVLGLGTFQSEPGVVGQAVKEAIKCGYRHIDCAFIYGNEREIGEAIQECIKDNIVEREDLFITTKLWNSYHRPDLVVPTCKMQLANLKLDYIDLYLVHWPFAYKENSPNEGDLFQVEQSILDNEVDYIDTWKQMEECVNLGLTKSIGLSNFNSEQITRLLANSTIKPVMNQIEVHPLLNQKKLIAFCRGKNIEVTAYSPFGAPTRPWLKPGDRILDLNDPTLIKIGQKYNKTTTQVILRYLIDIETIPIPKSTKTERLQSNINVFDFALTLDDIKTIDGFNCNVRVCPAEGTESHKYYPFHIEF